MWHGGQEDSVIEREQEAPVPSLIPTLSSASLAPVAAVLRDRRDGRVPLARTWPSLDSDAIASTVERDAVAERPTQRVGPFVLGAQLGAGGTAVVFKGVEPATGRIAAIKLQRSGPGLAESARTVLRNETAILGHLRHPSVLPLLDSGELADGRRWLALPLMSGGDLHALHLRLAAGDGLAQWPLRRRMTAFLSLCAAVEHAHSLGVVHRDLKPRNVMFDEFGFVYLADWGLAGPPTQPPLAEDPAPSAAGTPGYMAPEQITPRSGPIDARSDVWSLGAVLYEAITLRRAIPGRTITERMVSTLAGDPRDPREYSSDVPDALALACLRATERSAEDRFASVLDLAIAVGAAITGVPGHRRQ